MSSTSGKDSSCFLAADLYNAFFAHHQTTFKKDTVFRGWDTCEKIHDDEMELTCPTSKPYINFKSDSNSTFSINKCSKHQTGKDDKSANNASGSHLLSNGDSSGRSFSRFPYYGDLKDIAYDFRPYSHHQEHIEAYRKSHTYVIFKKYRDLRSSGITGYKLHAALKLGVADLAFRRLHTVPTKRIEFQPSSIKPSLPESSCSLHISPPLFYSSDKYNIVASSSFRRYKEEKRLAKDGRRSTIPIIETSCNNQGSKSLLSRPSSSTMVNNKIESRFRFFHKEKNSFDHDKK